MKNTCAVIAIILFTFLSINYNADASTDGSEDALLKVRAWEHPTYFRIVLEGPEPIISGAEVRREDENVIARFPESGFRIEMKKKMSIAHEKKENEIIFPMKNKGRLKSFIIKREDGSLRLVIDSHKKKDEGKREEKKLNKNSAKEAVKETTESAHSLKKSTDPEPGDAPATDGNMSAGSAVKESTVTAPSTEKAGENREANNEKTTGPLDRVPDGANDTKSEENYDEDILESDLIAEEYRKLWTLLESGNFYGVLKILPEYRPDNPDLLSSYHYIYARAYTIAQEYLKATEHYRLAYIYAADDRLKSRALLHRAELYDKLKLYYEARADYLVFIRDYPSSGAIAKAHLGLAETLAEIEEHNEALKHFEKAGRSAAALFGLANTLQKLDRKEEAKKAYIDAMLFDKDYPGKFPETNYLIGENKRLTGDIHGAKEHLESILFGPYLDKATVSLGLVALMEGEFEHAIRKFRTASESRDRKIQVIALFNLSKVLLKEDKLAESITCLEKIRNNYIDSSMYKETLLELARLYRQDGRTRDAVSMLKELVYGKQPPAGTFSELETILLEEGKKAGEKEAGELLFSELWNEVGQWMLHESREDFLLKIAANLRHEGMPYIEVCTWLVENASRPVSVEASINLADYYADMGNVELSKRYFNPVLITRKKDDKVFRIEAKIQKTEGNSSAALKNLLSIIKPESSDLKLLADIITDIDDYGSKEVKEAVAFYESALGSSEREADAYIRLADFFYENSDKDRALAYYRIAYKKAPDNEWVAYRVGEGAAGGESKEMLSRIQKSGSTLSQRAKTKLMEIYLLDKLSEVY